MVKEVFALSLSAVLLLSACGASNNTSSNHSSSGSSISSESVNKSTVKKNLLSVELTIPAEYVKDADTSVSSAKDNGFKVTKNDDGSLTYKLSKSQHAELVKNISDSIQSSTDELLDSGDYSSIKDIKYNDDYTSADMIVDYSQYKNSFDGVVLYALAYMCPAYQIYNGVDSDDVNTVISVVDEESGETMEQANAPKDFEEKLNEMKAASDQ